MATRNERTDRWESGRLDVNSTLMLLADVQSGKELTIGGVAMSKDEAKTFSIGLRYFGEQTEEFELVHSSVFASETSALLFEDLAGEKADVESELEDVEQQLARLQARQATLLGKLNVLCELDTVSQEGLR